MSVYAMVMDHTNKFFVNEYILQFAAAVLYAALSELVFSPKEYVCFSKAVSKIKDDPRVTIRLGMWHVFAFFSFCRWFFFIIIDFFFFFF